MPLKFQKNLIDPGDTVVVGVSGGVDSSVLLDLMVKNENASEVVVAHVNYSLRGKESSRDEKFVRGLAEENSCRFFLARPKIRRGGENIQSAARDFRYKFFADVACKTGASKIALAHHADDQAETVLLHLARGSGASGLVGMSHRRPFAGGIDIIRPLLELTKDEIRKYAAANKLKYVEDSTNKTKKYQRNAVRHELLPLLKRYNPSIVEHLCRTAAILRDEDDVMMQSAATAFGKICTAGEKEITFSRAGFLANHIAIQRRVLRQAYAALSGSTADLLADHVEKMLEIIGSPCKNGRYSLPKGIHFERNHEEFLLKSKVAL